MKIYFTGLNVCKQVGTDKPDIITKFEEIDIKTFCQLDENFSENVDKFDIFITTHYCLISIDKKLYCSSNLIENNLKVVKFDHQIKKITANNSNCLILLSSNEIYKFEFNSLELKKVNFTSSELIVDISCGSAFSSCFTKSNKLYNIPVELHQFEKHQKIKKLKVGNESGILLTNNGDCFTWGCGLRGQLGHGNIDTDCPPILVEALSGIKIVDVDTAGFHTHAVSAFGDLYSFGWNTNGELGLELSHNQSLDSFKAHYQSVFTTPQLIEFDENENIKEVHCGLKHTIIRTESGKIFGCGSNAYGQLGIDCNDMKSHNVSGDKFIDKFVNINTPVLNSNFLIKSFDFSTLIINF